ncbi:MAG TPA: YbhB/YbcL family Raf kinase inhibitor-like protein [Minicystis sp.]|nr:YbhB/YbcL family Raf kinase inhibitor-like protein [Minicystis sp.]
MHHARIPSILLTALALAACSNAGPGDHAAQPSRALAELRVSSAALTPNAAIPAANACADDEHLGKSPALAWSAGPAGTVAYAVTAVDPDAHDFVHWAVVDVPKETTALPEGASPGGVLPAGARELKNDFGKPGYGGPCPPKGKPHHYVFRVWALDAPVPASKADADFFRRLSEHALAAGTITVTHQR